MAPSKLIPIKIRGKGPRKKAWQPPAKAASKSDSKKRSRSSINENGDTTDSFSSRRKRRREKLALKKAPGAPIERLPKEILEMILLWSENLNFPKASHRIGCVLSGESTFTRVVLSAFGPTWDLWFGVRPCEIVTYCTSWMEPGSTVKDPKRMGGNPEFQTHPCTTIPNNLIKNPLRDPEKNTKLLYWLLRQGAKVEDGQSWEVTFPFSFPRWPVD
ncbi:hypothetical protein B0T14DRAFT_491495 [Immersiella caudata]|uniref:Uncharacterized protein n=1 Tax=Immersiella caudata TaxID=314043 RepID=A0AA39XGK5_9PEZI|nr:hypothetical protein B0T14DRAFT_491495 [Immersiella caudata]